MSPSAQPEAPPSTLKVAGVVSFYIVAAILMVTVNKWVLLSTSIPIFFLFVQLGIAVLLLLLCRFFRLLSISPWDTTTAKRLSPLITINVTGLIFNNFCLKYVDASFYQIARGLVLPITVGLALGLHQSPPSMRAVGCCLGVTVGFGVGVIWDNHSTAVKSPGFLGVTFGILSSFTTAAHSIAIKYSLPHVNNSAVQLAWYSNLLSTIAITPVFVLMGEVGGVLRMLGDEAELKRFVFGGLITGIVGFLICIAGFLSIKVTSPVTHMVSSAARGVVQTLLSVWFFGDIISSARALSISLITLASMSYVWVKHTESQSPPPPTSNKVLFDQDGERGEEAVPLTTRVGDEEAELESREPRDNRV